MRSKVRPSMFLVVAALTLLVTSLTPLRAAHAQATTASGPWGGSANTDLLRIQVLTPDDDGGGGILGGLGGLLNLIPGLNDIVGADLRVAPSAASVDSTAPAGERSVATAANAVAELLVLDLPIQQVTQKALPDNTEATEQAALPLSLDPLIRVSLLNGTAHARWGSEDNRECLPSGTALSKATTNLGELGLLGNQLRIGSTSQDGLIGGTSEVGLVSIPGRTNRGVQSTATAQLVGLDLMGIRIGVGAEPKLTALATGDPATSKVEWSAPLVNINDVALDPANGSSQAIDGGLIKFNLGGHSKSVSADGTEVTAKASLLTLGVGLLGMNIAKIELFPMEATAKAPVGGVDCGDGNDDGGDGGNPLAEVRKDVSAGNVAPGGTFNYTVSIPNRGTKPLTDVKVVDTITGPAGTTIAGTDPAGQVDGLTITWDVGTIAPNETKNFTIKVQTPTNAPIGSTYSNKVTATGKVGDKDFTGEYEVPNKPEVKPPAYKECRLNESILTSSHQEVKPGQTFNYYVHVMNNGATACKDITVTQTIPDNVDFVSCTANCTREGNTITWVIPNLGPGSSETVSVTVKPKDGVTSGNTPTTAVIKQPGKPDINLTHDGPTIGDKSVQRPINPPDFGTGDNTGGGGDKGSDVKGGRLANTGGNTPMLLLGGLMMAAVAARPLIRRSRS